MNCLLFLWHVEYTWNVQRWKENAYKYYSWNKYVFTVENWAQSAKSAAYKHLLISNDSWGKKNKNTHFINNQYAHIYVPT